MTDNVRIIPIQVEGREELVCHDDSTSTASESDKEQNNLSRSLKELSVETIEPSNSTQRVASYSSVAQRVLKPVEVKPGKSSPKVYVVKPAPMPSKNEQEYLKNFDVLEKRDGNSILSNYSLPSSDICEKIVLVIDRAQDENYTPFIIGSQKYTPLCMVKRAINIFIKLKLGINPHHEFAIILMNENKARFHMDFSNNVKKLTDCVNQITECETEDIFDLNSLFSIIEDAQLGQPPAPSLPPPYFLRTIIFYGRSYTLPEVTMTDKLQELLENPYFVCDILMTHEPVEAGNHCQKIFNILQNLDRKGIAYFFPVCRDLRRMHECVAKLLAHPLQRPIQKLIKN